MAEYEGQVFFSWQPNCLQIEFLTPIQNKEA